jgi:hypothetical protein
MNRNRARSLMAVALTAVALTTAAPQAGAATPATGASATEVLDKGRGAGFNVSWVEHGTSRAGRAAGLEGNTHVGFLQTFQNAGKPLFVDGVIQDYRCKPGQDVTEDECKHLGGHVITAAKAGKARVTVSGGLGGARLVGQVKVESEGRAARRLPVDLRLKGTGKVRPHHYLDEVISDDFMLRYEEIGKQRTARAGGTVMGSRVSSKQGQLLRFRWTHARSEG